MTERERARIERKRRLQKRRRIKRIKRLVLRISAGMAGVAVVIILAKAVAPSKTEAKQEDQIVVTLAPKRSWEVVPTTEAVTEAETETQGTLIASRDWDYDEGYMMAKIAMAEAEGEDVEGKALVILTVLNRVWSDDFPMSITDVIAQPGAFAAYTNGRYARLEPDEDCWAALRMVQVDGWDESRGALYFETTPAPGVSTWHNRNLQTLFAHGNHTFYK